MCECVWHTHYKRSLSTHEVIKLLNENHDLRANRFYSMTQGEEITYLQSQVKECHDLIEEYRDRIDTLKNVITNDLKDDRYRILEDEYQDICELSKDLFLPLHRESAIEELGEEGYLRFKMHTGL